jgi:hypothetical protein
MRVVLDTNILFSVKKNETTGPLHILHFGANAVMLDTNPVA